MPPGALVPTSWVGCVLTVYITAGKRESVVQDGILEPLSRPAKLNSVSLSGAIQLLTSSLRKLSSCGVVACGRCHFDIELRSA